MTAPVYLDHNASTPLDPAVLAAMCDALQTHYANPSSSDHVAGASAAEAVERARAIIATSIGARPPEITFCAGATEANNLALIGAFPSLKAAGRPRIVSSQIEHPSVLAALEHLRTTFDAEIVLVPVGEDGRVSVSALKNMLDETTGLVSIMTANNETGVLQPIEEIGALCLARGVIFHTDYTQAMAYRALDVADANVHIASFSAHKMYGPKGVGILYHRLRKPHVSLSPVVFGGGQERGLRAGTLNAPAIVATGTAFEVAERLRSRDVTQVGALREHLREGLCRIDGVRINGDQDHVLPNTMSISIEGIEPLALMRALRTEVVFSASSACTTESVKTSHVLSAMFGDTRRAREAFRLGLGRMTGEKDVKRVIEAFRTGVGRLRTGSLVR